MMRMSAESMQHPLWLYLLTHYKEKSTFVEGPLSNLQPSMIQFSRPKKSLASALDPFRRHESAANEYLNRGRVPGPAPSRFDPAYYRTHDTTSFVPPDAESVISQAVTSSFPVFPNGGALGKGKTYTGYASSVISQQPGDAASVTDGGLAPPTRASSIAFSQYDRLPNEESKGRRRLSIGSMAPSDAPTASMYHGYKAGDDDAQSIAPSQAGMTEF
jgi:regulator of nonsense transcripts 1